MKLYVFYLYNIIQWDTAGQERFKTITSAYYRGADCVLIVYDVTDRGSFNHIPDWMEEVNKLNKDKPLIVVLGNKCDNENSEVLENDRKVSELYNLLNSHLVRCIMSNYMKCLPNHHKILKK